MEGFSRRRLGLGDLARRRSGFGVPAVHSTYVTLSQEELEALIDSRAEAMVQREREERQETAQRERQEMEAMIKSLLLKQQQQHQQDKEEEEEEEFVYKPQEDDEEGNNPTSMPSKNPPVVLVEEGAVPSDQQEQSIHLAGAGAMLPKDAGDDSVERPRSVDFFKQEEEASTTVGIRKSSIEDEEWHAPFGETVYTLLYMCPGRSQGFMYGFFVYCLQMTAILLTLLDILELDAPGNPLQLPAMVTMEVTCAQAVTVFMLLAYMADLIEAVLKLQDGFYPEVLAEHPGATFSTWLISCLSQLISGLFLLLTSFVLIMQASAVIDLMLNLTALLFMAEIDDIGFALAKMGFVTDRIQEEALAVVSFTVPKRKRRNLLRRILYLLALGGLFVGYGIIKSLQLEGHYLPTNVYVQFGDAYNPHIPYYSGVLSSGNVRTNLRRQYRDLSTNKLLLGYCLAEKAWTFSAVDNPCVYFAKSQETSSYDVTSLPNSAWQVLDSIDRLQPFDSFTMVAQDCDPRCQGTCGPDGLCECPHDHFGMDCEFVDVCPHLVIDDKFEDFPPMRMNDLFGVSNEFQLLKNEATNKYVRVYNMPVYYSNKTYPANILFYGGRRWILTSEWDLFNLTDAKLQNPTTWSFPEKTVATLENGFHGYHQAAYTPFFISDPVDFHTPDFQPTPIGLKWWRVKSSNETLRDNVPDAPLTSLLVCQPPLAPSCVGQPKDFCGTGDCNRESGLCECKPWLPYHGGRCQLLRPCYDQLWPCRGRGECDQSSGFCRCHLPWYGKSCEGQYKCYEENGVCNSGGTCNMTTGDCDCPFDPAIGGPACEQRADCEVFGCANGGRCGWNGQCVCRPPYHGTHCESVDAAQEEFFCSGDEDCINGTCDLSTGICECGNSSSYGTLCERQFTCSGHADIVPVCLNSGTCNESSGICDCPAPFYGPDCSQVPPCFSDADCGHDDSDDTCDVDSGLCICSKGPAAGKRCQEKLSWCSGDADCYNGGTCDDGQQICHCTNGYGGFFCETIVLGMYNPWWDEHLMQLEQNTTRCGFDDPRCDRCFDEEPPMYCDSDDP